MSLFGRWSKEDDDYSEKVNWSAKKDLHDRLASAREDYERTGSPAARAAMTADTWRCTACATYNPNPRQVCDICGYTRTGHDTRKENA